MPNGISDKRITIEYKGKKINYYLHNSLNHVLVEGEDGPEPMELDMIEFYSGNEGVINIRNNAIRQVIYYDELNELNELNVGEIQIYIKSFVLFLKNMIFKLIFIFSR